MFGSLFGPSGIISSIGPYLAQKAATQAYAAKPLYSSMNDPSNPQPNMLGAMAPMGYSDAAGIANAPQNVPPPSDPIGDAVARGLKGAWNTIAPPSPFGSSASAAPQAPPGAAASPSPSPQPPAGANLPPGLGPMALGPMSAPLLQGSTGGWGPSASKTPMPAQAATPPGQPLSLAPPAPTQPPPNLYNGPGSQNYGQPVAPGAPWHNPDDGRSPFMNPDWTNPNLQFGSQPNGNYGGPHQGLISRIMQTLGNTFHTHGGMTSGWTPSDKWYNN